MIKTLLIAALLTLSMLSPPVVGAQSRVEDKNCGTAVDGLQMCLAASGSSLEVAFRNVGDHDLTLNLGIMLANGKVQLPTRVAMKLTDARGKTRVFKLGYFVVAGRVDDYVVPLRIGSIYTLQLTLDEFSCHETLEFSIPLASGDNYLTAQFQGSGVPDPNLDMPGIKLMNFWFGKVDSNTLTLRR